MSLRKHVTSVITTVLLGLLGMMPLTFASGSAVNARSAPNEIRKEIHLFENDKDLQALQSIKLSLQEATDLALVAEPGKALEAKFGHKKKHYIYTVKIVQQNGGVRKVIVNAETGEILKKK